MLHIISKIGATNLIKNSDFRLVAPKIKNRCNESNQIQSTSNSDFRFIAPKSRNRCNESNEKNPVLDLLLLFLFSENRSIDSNIRFFKYIAYLFLISGATNLTVFQIRLG